MKKIAFVLGLLMASSAFATGSSGNGTGGSGASSSGNQGAGIATLGNIPNGQTMNPIAREQYTRDNAPQLAKAEPGKLEWPAWVHLNKGADELAAK